MLGLTSFEILQKIQRDLQDRHIEPEKFEDRIIFMSMFNDIEWTKRGHSETCNSNSEQVKKYAKRFSQGHWTFLGPGDVEKWYGTLSYAPEGKWDSTVTQMVRRSKETGDPVLKSISALSRGILNRKKNRDTTHFNADASNTELLCPTSHSANQLSVYGAVSRFCEEFGQRPNEKEPTSERFVTKENEQLLKNVKPQEVNSLVQTPRSDNPASGNRLRESLQNFETLEKSNQFTKVCEDASFWKRVSVGMCCKTIADVDDGFWKSNSSMQRVYTPSCRFRFQNLCRNPRTNYNWTSYSSSYYTVSWHSWN